MSNKIWSRRELLKLGLGSAASVALFEGLGHLLPVAGGRKFPTVPLLPSEWSVADAYQLSRALGQRNSNFQLATLMRLQQAIAQESSNDWTLITVKVFDQVHPPLVFALGQLDGNGQVSSATLNDADHPALRKMKDATRQHLVEKKIKELSTHSRFKALRLNEWFGSRLLNGTVDGAAPATAANAFSYVNQVGPFPENVALQAGLCLGETGTAAVHQLLNAKLRDELCDLNHYAGLNLVKSPLGITCLMMGGQYDANGGPNMNVVYKGFATGSEESDIPGRSLQEILANIDQSLQLGFGDDRPETENLTQLFDKLVVTNPKMRRSILDSRASVKQAIAAMKGLGALEQTQLRPLVEAEANQQAELVFTNAASKTGSYRVGVAQQEFLSHCAYVAEALKIPGTPYRNFSLFLNLNDLDRQDLDESRNNSFTFIARSLNYIEGMRQLAMGMNILAKGIAGKKALVVVISDGARDADMGDGNGNSFAFVMGPKGEGLLDDALHGPDSIFNIDTSIPANVNRIAGFGQLQAKDLGWSTGGTDWGFFSSTGQRLVNERPTVGDWQVGALEFLAQMTGQDMKTIPGKSAPTNLGGYVRFKRKAS